MSDHPNIDRFREGVEAVRDRFADPLRVTVDFPTAAGALVEIEALVERAEAAEAKLSTLLCDLTGGLLSKPTYDVRTMRTYIEDHTQRLIDEEVREATAEADATVDRMRRASLVPFPTIAHKGPHDTDADMLMVAARKMEAGQPVGGSNVRDAIVRLIRNTVAAERTRRALDGEAGDE